jgi:aryl-alcohol dehydrogenase-like predicted oxidoreductase
MRTRPLGRSGLRVSEICLGAMTFGMPGWGCDFIQGWLGNR